MKSDFQIYLSSVLQRTRTLDLHQIIIVQISSSYRSTAYLQTEYRDVFWKRKRKDPRIKRINTEVVLCGLQQCKNQWIDWEKSEIQSISKIIQLSQLRGNGECRSRCESLKKKRAQNDRVLFRMKIRRQTLSDLTNRYNKNIAISYQEEQEGGYSLEMDKRRRISKTRTVSKVNRVKRTKFCKDKSGSKITEKMEESTIVVMRHMLRVEKNEKSFTWRKDDEKYLPHCVGQYGGSDRTNQIAVTFCGCVWLWCRYPHTYRWLYEKR